MGSNKALLALPGEGSLTFVAHLTSLLSDLCAEILLVARDEQSAGEYAFSPADARRRVVWDHLPDQGPLMGLASGLQAMSRSHALVLAVDLPFVRPELLAWLCAFPLDEQAFVPRVQGIPQVLLARYPRAILPTVEACLRGGRRDPRALLERIPVRFLEEEQMRAVDPDLRSFLNINTPEDLQRARGLR